MLEKATWQVTFGLPVFPSWAVKVKVIVDAVGVAVVDEKVKQDAGPALVLVMVAVTVAPVL
jgi:hypothetical protein